MATRPPEPEPASAFTTIRVSRAFGDKVSDLAQSDAMTAAQVCDEYLDSPLTALLKDRLAVRLSQLKTGA